MKVRVTRPCFIDSRLRTVGAEIDIRAELFSKACMEQLPESEVSEPAQSDPVSDSLPAETTEASAPKRRGRPPKRAE